MAMGTRAPASGVVVVLLGLLISCLGACLAARTSEGARATMYESAMQMAESMTTVRDGGDDSEDLDEPKVDPVDISAAGDALKEFVASNADFIDKAMFITVLKECVAYYASIFKTVDALMKQQNMPQCINGYRHSSSAWAKVSRELLFARAPVWSPLAIDYLQVQAGEVRLFKVSVGSYHMVIYADSDALKVGGGGGKVKTMLVTHLGSKGEPMVTVVKGKPASDISVFLRAAASSPNHVGAFPVESLIEGPTGASRSVNVQVGEQAMYQQPDSDYIEGRMAYVKEWGLSTMFDDSNNSAQQLYVQMKKDKSHAKATRRSPSHKKRTTDNASSASAVDLFVRKPYAGDGGGQFGEGPDSPDDSRDPFVVPTGQTNSWGDKRRGSTGGSNRTAKPKRKAVAKPPWRHH